MRESKSLALPFGDSPVRETGNVRDLSLVERSKINEKTTHDKPRLTESNRRCVTVTLSTVEHMTRCPCSSACALSAAYTVKPKMEDRL